MSRIRGGHNFSLIRFGTERILSHSNVLDGIIALDEETVMLHGHELKEDGFILCDTNLNVSDARAVKIAMEDMAKALGNPRVSGSIAVGVILKLFGESIEGVDEILKTYIDQKYFDINLKAIEQGYDSVENRYPHRDGNAGGKLVITGCEAIALGAIAAGLKFYSAYPMSPSTAIMEFLASKSREANIVVEQAEDEIAAINMAIGASYAGARAMTGTSGGGFSLMVEALGLSGMAEIPLVVVNMQRPGPATGFPTRTEQGDLKFMISASQGEFPRMVIALRHHEDAFFQTIRALNLAEKYQIPVVLLGDQYLADAYATVEPFDLDGIQIIEPAEKAKDDVYLRYRLTQSGISPRLIPGKTKNLVAIDSDEHDELGRITESADIRTKMVDKRMKKLELLQQEMMEPAFLGAENYDTLLIGWGSMYGPIAEALELLNVGSGGKHAALVFGDVFPLPQQQLCEKAVKARQIINVEQNSTGQLAGLVREYTGITCQGSVLKYDGRQLSGEEIAKAVMEEVHRIG
jgi:2-oxoglutarate ferredoxin oxidoreductase subunit alpha